MTLLTWGNVKDGGTSTFRRTIELAAIVFDELAKYKVKQNDIKMKYRTTYYDEDFVFAKIEEDKGYPEFIKTI